MVERKMHASRDADSPVEIGWRGWKAIAGRVTTQVGRDHIKVTSAGIAFYFMLAMFPALGAAVSIYGLALDPHEVGTQFTAALSALPRQASEMVMQILQSIVDRPRDELGWSLLVGILISIYSAKQGIAALFEGINIAYDEYDTRGFVRKTLFEFVATLVAIIAGIVLLGLMVVYPTLIDSLDFPTAVATFFNGLRWLLLAGIISTVLTVLYRLAPHRDSPKFRWVTLGALVATVLWLLGSVLFSLYADNFGNYDKTYGSFAAIIILMLWFFLTAFSILLGAEINAEMEHQTARDTTVGEDEPMGQRGAFHADHVVGDGSERRH